MPTVELDISDMVPEARRLVSLAETLQTALDREDIPNACIFEGAAYILWDCLRSFTNRLEELSK